MQKCRIWLALLICAALFTADTFAGADNPAVNSQAASPSRSPESIEVREFEVRVDTKPVGTHHLTIKSHGDRQEVAIQTEIKLNYLVYSYAYHFHGTEVWLNGQLVNSDVQCDDGGKKRAFSLKTDGTLQQVSFNGKSSNNPTNNSTHGTLTTAYWKLPSEDCLAKPLPIVDVDTGKIHEAKLTSIGAATVTVAGRSLKCQQFKIDGPSPAELWFDDHGCLVRQRSVESGHAVELHLNQIHHKKPEH